LKGSNYFILDSVVEIESEVRARRKPSTAKTMGLGPLAATRLRCIGSLWRQIAAAGQTPNKTSKLFVSVSSPLRAHAERSTLLSTAESGFMYRYPDGDAAND
jgi:hypothetical protein